MPSGSQDFVYAISLLTHLLEDDLVNYLAETHRVMKPGGRMVMSAFCLENVAAHGSRRWTFRHRRGAAHLESEAYPEAAVAYTRDFLIGKAERLGFGDVSLEGAPQSMLIARR